MWIRLVVNGEHCGEVWLDQRASDNGVHPLAPAPFESWYLDWLSTQNSPSPHWLDPARPRRVRGVQNARHRRTGRVVRPNATDRRIGTFSNIPRLALFTEGLCGLLGWGHKRRVRSGMWFIRAVLFGVVAL
jgi:hypothetical protein